MLKSPRDILLAITAPVTAPTLTVELTSKWYDVFVAHPDGTISTLDFYDDVPPYVEKDRLSSVVDHTFNPLYIKRIAAHYGYRIDPVAYDLIVGRWTEEALSQYPFTED